MDSLRSRALSHRHYTIQNRNSTSENREVIQDERERKDISSDDVVVTNERLQHVVETHPEISPENACEMMKNAVESPDMIIQDSHKEHERDTAIVMKRIDGKKLPKSKGNANMRLVMRLATGETEEGKKNSVITAILISEKKWQKYARNKKILYIRE